MIGFMNLLPMKIGDEISLCLKKIAEQGCSEKNLTLLATAVSRSFVSKIYKQTKVTPDIKEAVATIRRLEFPLTVKALELDIVAPSFSKPERDCVESILSRCSTPESLVCNFVGWSAMDFPVAQLLRDIELATRKIRKDKDSLFWSRIDALHAWGLSQEQFWLLPQNLIPAEIKQADKNWWKHFVGPTNPVEFDVHALEDLEARKWPHKDLVRDYIWGKQSNAKKRISNITPCFLSWASRLLRDLIRNAYKSQSAAYPDALVSELYRYLGIEIDVDNFWRNSRYVKWRLNDPPEWYYLNVRRLYCFSYAFGAKLPSQKQKVMKG